MCIYIYIYYIYIYIEREREECSLKERAGCDTELEVLDAWNLLNLTLMKRHPDVEDLAKLLFARAADRGMNIINRSN